MGQFSKVAIDSAHTVPQKTTFCCPAGWSLVRGFTVHVNTGKIDKVNVCISDCVMATIKYDYPIRLIQ